MYRGLLFVALSCVTVINLIGSVQSDRSSSNDFKDNSRKDADKHRPEDKDDVNRDRTDRYKDSKDTVDRFKDKNQDKNKNQDKKKEDGGRFGSTEGHGSSSRDFNDDHRVLDKARDRQEPPKDRHRGDSVKQVEAPAQKTTEASKGKKNEHEDKVPAPATPPPTNNTGKDRPAAPARVDDKLKTADNIADKKTDKRLPDAELNDKKSFGDVKTSEHEKTKINKTVVEKTSAKKKVNKKGKHRKTSGKLGTQSSEGDVKTSEHEKTKINKTVVEKTSAKKKVNKEGKHRKTSGKLGAQSEDYFEATGDKTAAKNPLQSVLNEQMQQLREIASQQLTNESTVEQLTNDSLGVSEQQFPYDTSGYGCSTATDVGFTYYLGSLYRTIDELLDWQRAALRCKTLHTAAHLVVINDRQEQNYIATLLNSSNVCRGFYWTAGNRFIVDDSDSPFIWRLSLDKCRPDALTEMFYTQWAPFMPDNYDSTESCVHLYAGLNGAWNDADCSCPLCAVCEIDLP